MRLHRPTFAPLQPGELPQPGQLFALDAEFVAYSPPEKALQRQAVLAHAGTCIQLFDQAVSLHPSDLCLRVHSHICCRVPSIATTATRRGVEVEVRPSRLGLARVSVLRGQGPARGTPCIDDYIKGAEPVYDYLTKYRCVRVGGGGGGAGGKGGCSRCWAGTGE